MYLIIITDNNDLKAAQNPGPHFLVKDSLDGLWEIFTLSMHK